VHTDPEQPVDRSDPHGTAYEAYPDVPTARQPLVLTAFHVPETDRQTVAW